ncbi:hypothetical protein RIF29_45466 [Crotalaria pallida]|uniref:Uncharacterized protein n=1 Tax=Crotalaria pallida TaxID=3830 RepID=A0AAN9HM63_CROPI
MSSRLLFENYRFSKNLAGLSLLAWKKGQRVLLLTQLCDIAIADKGSIRVPPPLLKGQAEEQPLGRPIDSSIPPDGIAAAKRAKRRRAQGRHLIRFATSL